MIDVRPLTRGELVELRSRGIDIFDFSDNSRQFDHVLDVLDVVWPDEHMDIPFTDALDLYRRIIRATIGIGDEDEKN